MRIVKLGLLLTGATLLSITLVAGFWLDLAPPVAGDLDYSVEIVAADGEPLHLYTTRDGYWRLPADSSAIDPRFLRMLLAYEDRRFWSHPGVDVLALARAAWQALMQGRIVSGASTLSMQTVRLLQPRPRTITNKLREMGLALELERRFSKREILELYLSLAPYGGNIQGIRAASRFYFGKEPRFLDHAEAALLVALPQSPERRRPDRFPEAARQARDSVLDRMLRAGVLTAKEARRACARAVPAKRHAAPRLAPHLAYRLRAANPDRQSIATRLDASLQDRLEALARRHQTELAPGVTLAMLVLDNRTGATGAYLGSGDFLSRRFPGQVDMVQALRSPGSALKPFIYGMGFDQGFLHPETLIGDRPIAVGGYAPGNFDRRYDGDMSVREALRRSRNIPAVRVLERLGPARFVRGLEHAGVHVHLPDAVSTPGLPVALGGIGISLEQLTALYASLAKAGPAVKTLPLAGKNDCGQGARETDPAPLLSPTAAWYVTDILSTSPLPSGFVRSEPGIAFKTGTSYGFRDAWAIGYDAGHTVGIWIGRPDGGYTPALTGLQSAVPVLMDTFDQLPREGLAPLLQQPPARVLRLGQHELSSHLQRLASDHTLFKPADAGPRIRYPPEGSQVELGDSQGVLFEIGGGRAPFHWLADGRYLGVTGTRRHFTWNPAINGAAHITVLDSRGRSDSVRFRVHRQGVR